MDDKQTVTIEFVGMQPGAKEKNTFERPVSAGIEAAVDEVRNFIESRGVKMSYTLYLNGKFISQSSARGSDIKVKTGDVFKVIPIMGGG